MGSYGYMALMVCETAFCNPFSLLHSTCGPKYWAKYKPSRKGKLKKRTRGNLGRKPRRCKSGR